VVLGIILLVVGLALGGFGVYSIISGALLTPRQGSAGPLMAGNVTDEVRRLYAPVYDFEGNRRSVLRTMKWLIGIGVVLCLVGLILIF
jgi:hypothetical protein